MTKCCHSPTAGSWWTSFSLLTLSFHLCPGGTVHTYLAGRGTMGSVRRPLGPE